MEYLETKRFNRCFIEFSLLRLYLANSRHARTVIQESTCMNHIFGPVNSRRLGRSLGIDLFTDKICTLNCIYCEVGATQQMTCARREYVPTTEIVAEIDQWFGYPGHDDEIDVVTVTASGEPTLHSGLGRILAHIRTLTDKPLCVLTNGTTLMDRQVRQELGLADIVIPSLDAARADSFRRLDRPAACVRLDEVIDGLIGFSHEYQGRLWLEILFARGINDSDEDLRALQRVVQRMRLERIQINTVDRPPLESFAHPVDGQRLGEIAAFFRERNPDLQVDCLGRGGPGPTGQEHDQSRPDNRAVTDEVSELLKRRPCTAADIETIFHCKDRTEVEQILAPLIESEQVEIRSHGDRTYYTWKRPLE